MCGGKMSDKPTKNIALEDRIKFVDDKKDKPSPTDPYLWKILIVDDEPDVHRVTELALSDVKFSDQPISFLHAYSEEEAREIIAKEWDIALILLDVVMEGDYSGLKLVNYVRDDRANAVTQIIIRTAYPSLVPERSVIMEYDINGYINKEDATASKLSVNIVTALRRYSKSRQTIPEQARISSEDQIMEDLSSNISMQKNSEGPLKILIVDDEESVHSVTKFVLRSFSFEGREVINLHAYSAKEAKLIIDEHHDVAVILLDIIMETNDAGLDVIKYVRNTLELTATRIILRTGQAGNLDVRDLIESYDINGFKNKSEITAENFFGTIYTSLRSYKQVVQLEKQQDVLLSYMSSNNSETILSDKRLFDEHPITRLKRSTNYDRPLAIMMVELGQFNQINDTLKENIRNQLLTQVIQRILLTLRDSDLVGRFGDSDLVVLLEDFGHKKDIADVARRIIKALSQSFVIDEFCMEISASIGITIRNSCANNSQLLREADIAMRDAKLSGGNTFRYYSQHMDETIQH